MRIYKYKKIFSIFILTVLIAILLPLNLQNTKASSKLDFSLVSDTVDNNRLFDVNLVAKGDADLSACSITVTYDTEYVEFRSVSSPDKAFEIKKKVSNGKVTALVLSSYGYSFSGNSKIISFKFKSISSGSSNFGLGIFDPTDNKGDKLSIGSVYGAKVTINGSKITSKSIKNNNGKTTNVNRSSSKTYSAGKSSNSVKVPKVNYANGDSKESTSTSSTIDTAYVDNSEPHSLFFIGVLATLGFVFIICVAYRMGKTSKENNDNNINKEDK